MPGQDTARARRRCNQTSSDDLVEMVKELPTQLSTSASIAATALRVPICELKPFNVI